MTSTAMVNTQQSSHILKLLDAVLLKRDHYKTHLKNLKKYLNAGGDPDATVYGTDDRFCARNSDCTSQQPVPYTLLMVCAQEFLVAASTALLDAGASPDRVVGNKTALSAAAGSSVITDRADRLKIMQLLVSRGAQADAGHGIALQAACCAGHTQAARFLVEHGTDLHRILQLQQGNLNYGFINAMSMAAWQGHLELLRYLHAQGASPIIHCRGLPWTSLHASAQADRSAACTQWLLAEKLVHIDALDSNKETPLHFACRHGSTANIRTLLAVGADSNVRSLKGETPLTKAVVSGSIPAVQLLLKHPGFSLCDDTGAPCTEILTSAAAAAHMDCAQAILTSPLWQNLSKSQQVHCQRAMLQSAADLATIEAVVKVAIDLQTMIEYRDSLGGNALHAAAMFGKPATLVCKLIKMGVDLAAKNNQAQTPAEVARETGHTLLAQLLDRAAQDRRAQA